MQNKSEEMYEGVFEDKYHRYHESRYALMRSTWCRYKIVAIINVS